MAKLTQKRERFCLNLFQGMSQRDAYIAAGYSPKQSARTIDSHASALARTDVIMARCEELRQKAEDASIADIVERKQVLTEIVRGRFINFMTNLTAEKLRSAALQEIRITESGKEEPVKTTTIKLHSPIQAIDLLNKMDKIYSDAPVFNDNRRIEIHDAKGKLVGIIDSIASRIGEGEGSQLPDGG